MTIPNNFVFKFLQVIAWIIFVGLCIEAGALLVNFIFSIYKPQVVQNLYQKLNLSQIYQHSQWVFYGVYSFILSIALLKAYLFYLLIKLLTNLDLSRPFNTLVSKQITQISYFTLYIGILSYIARKITNSLTHYGLEISTLKDFWTDSQAFILMAAILYVIAQIFAKGVEIQNENDLTV